MPRSSPWVVVLALLPWITFVGGGMSMCVLYEPGERVDGLGYSILAFMVTPLLIWAIVVVGDNWRRPYLDVDCTWCGRSFYGPDLPAILQTHACPHCDRPVPSEDLDELKPRARPRG